MGPQVKNISTRDLSILMIQLIVVYQLIITKLYAADCSDWSCNFDSSTCNWTQDTSDDFNWSRHSGATFSTNTGPSSDHTRGRGFYMFIETSYSGKSGDKARLISPAINGRTRRCLEFYYHMYGRYIDTLSVYFSRSGSLGRPVWTKHNSQGNEWKRATVQIDGGSKTETVTNIVIEGARRYGYYGGIAFDDVRLTPGICDQELYAEDCSDWSCNFDCSTCNWIQDTNDDFNWSRHSDGTKSSDTGPSSDHTSGRGLYMYIETSKPRKSGDIARLISPAINGRTRRCLEFYYHMYGSNINMLSVYFSRSGSLGSPAWARLKSQGNEWKRATVQIDGGSKTETVTNIVIEGTRGDGIQGDIAFDDVRLTPGICDQEPLLVHIEPTSDMIRISEGENLTANCVVSDAIPNITSIEWLHNGRISSGDTFHIQHVTQADEGRLTCTARNGEGTSPGRTDVYIRVQEKREVWIKINMVGVITGVVAGISIVVVVVIHLYRKLRLVSGKGQKRKPQKMVVAANPIYDLQDINEGLYVNVATAREAITQDGGVVYEEVTL